MTHPFKAGCICYAGAKILNRLCPPRWDFRAASESAPVGSCPRASSRPSGSSRSSRASWKRRPRAKSGCMRSSTTATACTRGSMESLNAGWVPFAASRGCYLSLAQFACDGIDGDKASFLNLSNCRGQRLGSHVRSMLLCLSIVDPGVLAPCDQAQACQHPRYSGAVPSTALRGRYSSSVESRTRVTDNRPMR
jgi:hypothetical protein